MEVPENDTTIDPTSIPIPSSGSEASHKLFVDEENNCFTCSADQVWKIEIEITQKDIDNWREESQPSCMAFVVSAAKKQCAEVKLSEPTDSDRKLFEAAKGKEIDSWISTDTVAKILRHRIPQEISCVVVGVLPRSQLKKDPQNQFPRHILDISQKQD